MKALQQPYTCQGASYAGDSLLSILVLFLQAKQGPVLISMRLHSWYICGTGVWRTPRHPSQTQILLLTNHLLQRDCPKLAFNLISESG